MPYQDVEARATSLQPRLKPILCAVLEGRRNAEIADDLSLAVHTVENYVSELLAEFECRSRVELILALTDVDQDKLRD